MDVKKGELLSIDKFNEEIQFEMIEDDEIRERTETVGYYCKIVEHSGFEKWVYWTKKKMEIHADTYSPAFNLASYNKILEGTMPANEMWKYSSFWYKNFDEMAFKTMLRHTISRWGQMSIELQEAIMRDEEGTYENKNVFDVEEKVNDRIETNANKKVLDVSDMVEIPQTEKPIKEQPKTTTPRKAKEEPVEDKQVEQPTLFADVEQEESEYPEDYSQFASEDELSDL